MKNKRLIHWLMLAALLCAFCAVQTARYGFVRNSAEQIDLIATARNILSMEPPEVKQLRSRKIPEAADGQLEYYFNLLTEREQRAYREMLDSFMDWKPEFYLTISGENEIDRVFHAVMNDHPELFWVRNRKTVYKTIFHGQDYSKFTPSYAYSQEGGGPGPEVTLIREEIDEACRRIDELAGTAGSDYEKAAAVYTYVIDQTAYVESADDQSVAGVFWKKEAVCAGYAGAVQLLLEHLGVDCIYVEGTSVRTGEGHAWNLICLDGEWFILDATNGDQPEFLSGDFASLAEHKTTLMDYLCPFPSEYEADYKVFDTFPVPACTSVAYNFYVMNQGCFDIYDPQALNAYFKMRIDYGAAVIRFKFSNPEAYAVAAEDWVKNPQMEDAIQYYMVRNDLAQLQYHYGLLSELFTMYFIF